MINLYRVNTKKKKKADTLSSAERASILYHNLFDFPLSFSDLIKWKAADGLKIKDSLEPMVNRQGFFSLESREGLVYKRLLRKRISAKKIQIAKRAAKLISLLPTVKMIAVTGSLAMENSAEQSDVDLMVVAKSGSLWTTRLLTYSLITLLGLQARNPKNHNQKDKLCLNIWLDENDLLWPKRDRNIYTAHEILQIVPLVNKDRIYETFLFKNKWAASYWPNAINMRDLNFKKDIVKKHNQLLLESFVFQLQYKYMEHRVTRETITKTRALFHPQDWSKVVLARLQK